MNMHVEKPVVDYFLRATKWLSGAGAVLAGLAFALMTVLILAEVLLRTFLGKSTLIASEYSGYMLAAMIYLGLAYSFSQKAHIRITFMKERLSGRPLHILELFCTAIAAVLCALSTWFLWDMVEVSFVRGATAYTVAETPLWIPQLVILVGMSMMTIQVLAYFLYLVFSGVKDVDGNMVDYL